MFGDGVLVLVLVLVLLLLQERRGVGRVGDSRIDISGAGASRNHPGVAVEGG